MLRALLNPSLPHLPGPISPCFHLLPGHVLPTLFPIHTGLCAPPHTYPALSSFWNFAHTPICPCVDQGR